MALPDGMTRGGPALLSIYLLTFLKAGNRPPLRNRGRKTGRETEITV